MLLRALAEALEKSRLEVAPEEVLGQLNGPGGVLDHLHGFDPGNLIEEPTAARVHEHRMTLHFQQLEAR